MDWTEKIKVWNETCVSSKQFPKPEVYKYVYNPHFQMKPKWLKMHCSVQNKDSITLGKFFLDRDSNPLVLIFADNRFAGGDVKNGSGAQEESIFRRTNICCGLQQHLHYPIFDTEAVICKDVVVYKNEERYNCSKIVPFQMDFIACPGIHNPDLENERFSPKDEERFRQKLRCIFQAAYINNNDSLVLGPLGCGAWRCPPIHTAEIMKDEINKIHGCFKCIFIACLEVNLSDYIVRHHDRENKPTNFAIFKSIF